MNDEYITYKVTDYFKGDFGTHLTHATKHKHTHDFWEMFYVIKGSSHHFLHEVEEILGRGDFYLLRPQDKHYFDDISKDQSIHRDIVFSTERFKSICEFVEPNLYEKLLKSPTPIRCTLTDENMLMLEMHLDRINLVDYEDFQIRESLSNAIGATLLGTVIEYKYFKNEKYPRWFNEILSLMQTSEILQGGIEELVKASNFSHGHLCRIFKKFTGKTINHYLTELRMAYSSTLLRNTNFSISEIAYKMGYENSSHFIAIFKKSFNLTPYSYKQKMQINYKNDS